MNLFDNLIDLTNVENNPFNSFNQRDEPTSKPSLENQLQVLKEFDALTKEFNSNTILSITSNKIIYLQICLIFNYRFIQRRPKILINRIDEIWKIIE